MDNDANNISDIYLTQINEGKLSSIMGAAALGFASAFPSNLDAKVDNRPQKITQTVLPSSKVKEIKDNKIASYIIKHEGYKQFVYLDTKGIPTIGIGFNLKKSGAKDKIQSLGLNYKDVVSGHRYLSEEQIYTLFYDDLMLAIEDAKVFIGGPKIFSSLHPDAQLVLIDLSFNLGINKLNQFVKFKSAMQKKDYWTASKELIDSKWYDQVGNRGKNNVNKLKSLTK